MIFRIEIENYKFLSSKAKHYLKSIGLRLDSYGKPITHDIYVTQTGKSIPTVEGACLSAESLDDLAKFQKQVECDIKIVNNFSTLIIGF